MNKKYILQLFRSLGLVLLLVSMCSRVIAQQSNEFDLSSPVSGVVKTVYVSMGKDVKAGELLLEFDTTLIVSNLSAAQSVLQLAKLNRSEAKKELDRAVELYERTVLSEFDLQLAKLAYVSSQADYSQAHNELVHAQWESRHSKLYAGFAGKIINVYSYPGQYVNNQFKAQSLLRIRKN